MTNFRETINSAISEERWGEALMEMKRFLRQNPNLATAQFALNTLSKIQRPIPSLPFRLAILRSFTIEPAILPLRADAALHGIDLDVQVGDFNTYVQDILDPGSRLYLFEPHAVLIAVQTRDLIPALWNDFSALTPADVAALTKEAIQNIASWINVFRERSAAHLIIQNLEMPVFPNGGILDGQTMSGQCAAIHTINDELIRLAKAHVGVYVLDYEGLVSRYGRLSWHDERKWLTARMPIAAEHLFHYAQELNRFLLPLSGKVCKALAVDLDNTLWGGVIGEDGMQGIQLGSEYPGAAFLALQRAILDLYQRGIILAICSKNNPSDALEAIDQHPAMLLRSSHFAAIRINWQDKAHNLREIAKELNIGIDALAFLDDNPVERQRVSSELPEVTVIELPEDAMQYARTLRETPVFERFTLSTEDRERGRYYAEQRQRTELEQSANSIEDFYRSLQMEVEITPVTPNTLVRTAQLTQKTNQFNLTTRRYSEQQIEEKAQSPDWSVLTLRVHDRFGDNGLVGVAILHYAGTVCEIDTFLLSCRVIGRTVETAFLSVLASLSRERGATRLRGWFLPTRKNAPARDFYQRHDFQQVKEDSEGALWEINLETASLAIPAWIAHKIC